MNASRRILIHLLPLLAALSAQAQSSQVDGANASVAATDALQAAQVREDRPWIERHAEGWFWRDVDPEPETTDTDAEENPVSPQPVARIDPNTLYPPLDQPLADPLAELERVKRAIETSQARVALQPTNENILNWMRVQAAVFRRSSLFADNMQRLSWRNPDLDYNQVRPYNPVALKTYSQQFKQDRREALREIARDYGLYFVIAESCPYCHAMAPYLKRFAENYGFTVVTVTIDGGTVPEFPDAMYSPEFAEKLNVKITPAIILARPSEGVIEPVSYGFIDLKELEMRIYRLFRMEPGQPTYQVETQRIEP